MSEVLKAPRSAQAVDIIPSVSWTQAAQDARAKAQAHPACPDTWMELGLELRKQMLFREAIEAYSQGLTCAPFHAMLYRHRGHALVNVGAYAAAAADFEMCLRIDPDNWSAWYHLGLSYHLMGAYERALAVYAQCLSRSHDDYHRICTTDWYCMTLMKLGRLDEMREIAARIVPGMEAGDAQGYYGRDLVYSGMNDARETLDAVRKEDDHLFATGAYGLAVYLEYALGDEPGAMEILREIEARSTLWSGFAEQAAALRMQGIAK